MIYEKLHIVSGTECGINAELSLYGSFSIVQNVVTELLGRMKIDGITVQKKYGGMWVFSKNKLSFQNNAYWGTRLFIQSFISKIMPARFEVSTLVRNDNNVVIFQAKTEVCGIDVVTQKIRTVDSMGVVPGMIDNINEQFPEFSKIIQTPSTKVSTETIKTSNIDFCHHTNNVEYIRFVVNSYSPNELYERKVNEFQINYIAQSYLYNMLAIYKDSYENKDVLDIRRGDSTIVKCELTFNKSKPRADERIY